MTQDLWMVDKSSHYEYLATYMDVILIWSKDPMAAIKSLEKLLIKECTHSRILFRRKCGIPLENHGKNQELALALSARNYIQNVISKFEKSLWQRIQAHQNSH